MSGRRRGGTLTMVLSAEPPGLDPGQLQGVQNWAEAVAVACVFDALFYPDASGVLQPKIGESITSSDGGTTWLVTLRPGIHFADGTPLDSEALRFNWDRLAGPDSRSPVAAQARLIERMDVLDPRRLQVMLKRPQPRWDMVVARSLSTIGSPTALADAGEEFSRQPVGAGPFTLAEWERGSHMRFLRNPGYWQEGKPLLDEIIVLTGIADAAPKYEALADGRAQVALEPLGGNIARYRAQPDRFALLTTPETGGGVALAMNVMRPPFDDLRIREAMALVLDSGTFVDAVGYGDPGMVMTTIDRAGTPLCDPEIRLPVSDVARAQELIDEAVAQGGEPVRFALETFANEGHIREANTIKQMIEDRLRQVEVEVKVGSVADLAGRWRTGEYQATNYAVRWSDSVLDLPANFASSSGQNIMGYHNPAVDEGLEALAVANDSETAVELHRQVLRQVLRDLPVIWLSHKEAFHVVDMEALRDWKLFYSLRPMLEDAWLAEP